MKSYKTLPLFPDLLERADLMKRNFDWERIKQTGHAVWCIDDLPSRAINDDLSESVCLAVIYDDERFHKDKTGKKWIVEIKHHFYEYKMVKSGWGKSIKNERKLFYRARIYEKRFLNRESACEFAEKVQAVFEKIKTRMEKES